VKQLGCILLLMLTLAACATAKAKKIQDTYLGTDMADMVKECEYLGEVKGWSGWGKWGVGSARNSAKNSAAELGATHIIWTGGKWGPWVSVHGDAYRCDSY
jgi:hypothetical protein